MEAPSRDYMDIEWERYAKAKAVADEPFTRWGNAGKEYYTALLGSLGFHPGDVVQTRESEYASPRFSWRWDGQIRANHFYGEPVIVCHCQQVKANGEDAYKSAWVQPRYLIEGVQRREGVQS